MTTRLQCILPQSVFFIHKQYAKDPRFSGLRNIINGSVEQNDNVEGDRNEIEIIRNRFLPNPNYFNSNTTMI